MGMMIVSRGRCLCIGPGVNFIRPRSIKTIEVYFPSTFCEKMEVIVTLKNKKVQKCLNPDSEFAKNFIRNTQRSKSSSSSERMAVVSTGRCLCIDEGVNFIKLKNIQKVEVYAASSSCEKMEIIVTLKGTGEKKCLNPESKFAKNFIKKSQRHK
ncbi:c-X-C motif chemokine 11-like, partial [Scleropages formosus]